MSIRKFIAILRFIVIISLTLSIIAITTEIKILLFFLIPLCILSMACVVMIVILQLYRFYIKNYWNEDEN